VQGLTFYALNTARFTRPLLRQPQADAAFVVRLFRAVPANDAPALSSLQQSNRELLARMVALGGKRYSPYSDVLSDPSNVLSPGPVMFAAAIRESRP
jgi:hypothetical protein